MEEINYFEEELSDERIRQLGDSFWINLLKTWDFETYPVKDSDEFWLYKLCKYIYKGAPNDSFLVLSNSSGYWKLSKINGDVYLFDDIENYSPGIEYVNGDTRDFSSDELQNERYRVLINIWHDVEEVIPGLQQEGENRTWSSATPDAEFYGNTCLLKLKESSYSYVRGGFMSTFTIDEPVEAFYSFLANNTVPEPLIVTKTKIYSPEHGVYFNIIPNIDLRNDFVFSDIYREVYKSDSKLTTVIKDFKIIFNANDDEDENQEDDTN